MEDKKFIEDIIRVSPDVIYSSPTRRTIQTAEKLAEILKEYTGKIIEIKINESLLPD